MLHREKRIVPPSERDVPLSRVIAGALAGYPGGKATRIDTPVGPGRTAQVFVTPEAGDPVRVFVDPGTGDVVGSYIYHRTLVGLADVMHGSLMMGNLGDAIVELAACWGFILTVTGLYLWWPRGRFRVPGRLLPRWHARGRAFWKSVHATFGLWSALLVLFLILTGLPSATVWGGLLRAGTEFAGIGYPSNHRGHGAPVSSSLMVGKATDGAAPWTVEAEPMPTSDAHHGGHHGPHARSAPTEERALGIDEVEKIIAVAGLPHPYRLTLPTSTEGVYAAFTYPDQPETQRTLYIDQYSGRILGDVRFGDYGWAAKAVELGVQTRMGNYFGRLNQFLLLVPCIGIVVLTITGPFMWWQRRPKDRIGAPRTLADTTLRTMALITLGLSLIFPLAGASLLIVLVTDAAATRLVGRSGPEAA